MDVIEVQIKFSTLEHEAFYLNVVPSEHAAQTVVAYTELFNRLGFQPKTFGYGRDAFEALGRASRPSKQNCTGCASS